MNKFKDFNIKNTSKSFVGDKIKMSKILNREITVHDYRIEDTKCFKATNPKCLHLQISIGEQKYVVFTSGGALMEDIEKVPKDKFPFVTTIVAENERYLFT